MLVLVWCQVVAAVHATEMAGSLLDGPVPASGMAEMPGCDGLPDDGGMDMSDCPSEGATAEAGKLPVFLPLLPWIPVAIARMDARGEHAARHWRPQGRAPPCARLCRWLI